MQISYNNSTFGTLALTAAEAKEFGLPAEAIDLKIMDNAQVSNWGTDGEVRYYAPAIDAANNDYQIEWQTTEAWDAACAALANNEEPALDAPDTNDESNACDWNSPYSIKLV